MDKGQQELMSFVFGLIWKSITLTEKFNQKWISWTANNTELCNISELLWSREQKELHY